MPKPKVALVYDRVNTRYGGAEQVLLAIKSIFPEAPLFTSVYDPSQAKWSSEFEIKPSFLQSWPGASRNHRWLAPLMPLAFESLDLSEFEIVISITSAEAKGVITKPHQLHICYLLTPTRYLYSHRHQYLESVPFSKVIKPFLNHLTRWDQVAITRPDVVIPISELVKERIKKYYHLSTEEVIYPPVELPTQIYPAPDLPFSKYFLSLSRLVDYKRIDLSIRACLKLGKNLVVAGDGPSMPRLKKMAQNSNQILFLGEVSSRAHHQLLAHSQALLMPGQEDFGITALESNAHGRPVIIHQKSGAAEIISGIKIKNEFLSSLSEAIIDLDKHNFSSNKLSKYMKKYDKTVFVEKFKKIVDEKWRQHVRS